MIVLINKARERDFVMKTMYYVLALLSITSYMHNAQACAVTIINDSLDPIIVTTNDPHNAIFALLPEQEKEFGEHHVKAKFTVLFKDNAGNYIQQVAARQYACSAGKDIRLHVQDLAAKRINTNWFVIGDAGAVDVRKMEFCH